MRTKILLDFSLGCTKIFAVLTIKRNLWEEKLSQSYYKEYKKILFWDNYEEQYNIRETKRCKLRQTEHEQK